MCVAAIKRLSVSPDEKQKSTTWWMFILKWKPKSRNCRTASITSLSPAAFCLIVARNVCSSSVTFDTWSHSFLTSQNLALAQHASLKHFKKKPCCFLSRFFFVFVFVNGDLMLLQRTQTETIFKQLRLTLHSLLIPDDKTSPLLPARYLIV